MKIGFDIHGVSDTDTEFFSYLSNSLIAAGHSGYGWEVHILTGSSLKNGNVENWLKENNIAYTHLFSIADYLEKEGHEQLPHSTPDNPWYPKEIWNKVKGRYCEEHKIDLCLDDEDCYLEHFTTPVARYYSKKKTPKKIKCASCGGTIKAEDIGAIQNGAYYHSDVSCLMDVKEIV